MTGRIVVSGGAGFWSGDDGLRLDRHVMASTGLDRPKVCLLPTASGDLPAFIEGFHAVFGRRCRTSHLPLFIPPFTEPADVLGDADVIYVPGGSTSNLLAVWRLHRIDRLLRDALDRGATLYGSSAGGLCWFEAGLSDSLGFDGVLRPLTNGLGFVAGSHCPHFDHDGRRTAYGIAIAAGALPAGLGIDDFCAVELIDGDVGAVIAATADARAHRVQRAEDGDVRITTIEPTVVLTPVG